MAKAQGDPADLLPRNPRLGAGRGRTDLDDLHARATAATAPISRAEPATGLSILCRRVLVDRARQLSGQQRAAHTLLGVKRVLLTGMSGTGKSSVVRELAARGFKAVDTDDGWSEPLPDGRQLWREDAIQALLATEDADVLFVAGCEENQAQFHAQFDHIILLSAPLNVLLGRLAARTSNPYGKAPEELSRIVNDIETVEPLLRRVADHEVQTTIPLREVVTAILQLVDA
jgi:dephospho-CoA kinase